MRWGCGSVVFVMLFAATTVWIVAAKTPTHAYRLTVEVNTPTGSRRGSVVRQVFAPCPGFVSEWSGIGPGVTLRGEAVFVDLGGGKNLVALMAAGPSGNEPDQPNYIAYLAFREAGLIINQRGDASSDLPMCKFRSTTDRTKLPVHLLPTLVTFTDLHDPTTGRVIEPTDIGFSSALGVGYELKSIEIEMVSVGVWPLNLIGVWGTPATKEILAKIPFLNSHRAKLWNTPQSAPTFDPMYHQFERD